MYKVYSKTTYYIVNERTYSKPIDDISDELTANKLAQALNEQEETHAGKLADANKEIFELRSVLPS